MYVLIFVYSLKTSNSLRRSIILRFKKKVLKLILIRMLKICYCYARHRILPENVNFVYFYSINKFIFLLWFQ